MYTDEFDGQCFFAEAGMALSTADILANIGIRCRVEVENAVRVLIR